ncbi:DnaA regulatory inactivator Hda [Aquicella lusitana]|uniref:Regulatory inactivation of DnaA Hda protein n=1 Tax=Aquicella lusitana TaxID=254246 RepID=A0A370G7S6_9COXI|nr:DnaA regulatory inactivator Hda [Aquicella lusitana]RDI39847.1 regulatory inactivation of DnaA Hda protein [Aquicella lusitana]VVC73132.1 DnaA regulatory inactivator Hda [Aquicella lusitana]
MIHKSSAQLTLGLSLKDEATFDNFYAGKNAEMISALKKTSVGEGERVVYLCGSRGQGLSHLLQACCHYAHQQQRSSVYLPLAQLLPLSPEVLSGLEMLSLICLDDVHVVAGLPEWEEAIFHLYNRIYDAGGSVVITGNELPKSIPMRLPDLVSRLSWGVVYQLYPLSDEEKRIVLTMSAMRRGISLPEEVGKYILTHCPRHMGTLVAALDALDKASLAAQRRLTIPFVKEVLEI